MLRQQLEIIKKNIYKLKLQLDNN